jgi:hypothetical protein
MEERFMASARKRRKQRRRVRTLGDCLRQFLTPAVWKQAQKALARPWQASRWRIKPLLVTLVLMTFACGDSQEERFESTRAVMVALQSKRRRPGATLPGFQLALGRLPIRVLRAVVAGVRAQLPQALLRRWQTDGFVVLGCDGSRLECTRIPALETRLGKAGKTDSAPSIWLTAIVHLATGVPWAWRFGKATASERDHLGHLLETLPAMALMVCDAGYVGFELCRQIMASGADFLIRMSSIVTLYTEREEPLTQYREGIVYYWPEAAQKRGDAPLRLRLLRVVGERKTGPTYDVWMLTSVLSAQRLPLSRASQWYRWRWENEGYFRTYKRTLSMVKLTSRKVSLVHREAEGSMLAAQLLLAATAMELSSTQQADAKVSPRQALREFRREFRYLAACRRREPLGQRLSRAVRECRPNRTSPKATRVWPRRGPHEPPKPPKILTLDKLKKPLKPAFKRAA